MRRIFVISDTHGGLSGWKKFAERFLKEADLLIHAGDVLYHGPRNPLPEGYDPKGLVEELNGLKVPIIFSRGNCDADIDQLLLRYPLSFPYAYCFIDGLRMLITHSLEGIEVEGFQVDLVVHGHTHVPAIERKGRTIFLNPGSLALPKGAFSSFAAIDLKGGKAELFSLDGEVLQRTNF